MARGIIWWIGRKDVQPRAKAHGSSGARADRLRTPGRAGSHRQHAAAPVSTPPHRADGLAGITVWSVRRPVSFRRQLLAAMPFPCARCSCQHRHTSSFQRHRTQRMHQLALPKWTQEGMTARPCSSRTIVGDPSLMTATADVVVPRSMPTAAAEQRIAQTVRCGLVWTTWAAARAPGRPRQAPLAAAAAGRWRAPSMVAAALVLLWSCCT